MEASGKRTAFEAEMLPHLGAAYNLARWLIRNHHDAEDAVQEAYLRAFRAFDDFRGAGDGRSWLLTIVRNTCYTRVKQGPADVDVDLFDEQIHTREDVSASPESQLIEQADAQLLRRALDELPPEFREAIVLRELEGLSYKEMADVAGVPLGTIMSRLARARARLEHLLKAGEKKETRIELPAK